MKKIFLFKQFMGISLLIAVSALLLNACQKDSDGSPQIGSGNMTLSAIDPVEGPGGATITLNGSGLGDIRSIMFDKGNVPAPVTSTLNTASALIFRVPDTAIGGPQNVIFTNSAGQTLSVPFKVIALPTVNAAFPTDFVEGTEVKLSGNNLDDVTSVVFEGSGQAVTILSKSKKEMVVRMPASEIFRAKLKLTNASGIRITDQVFVNAAKGLMVFSDQLDNGFQSWSWGGDFNPTTDDKITGTASMKAAYDPKGEWGGMQLGGGLLNLSGYKYFSFWVKGADEDKNLQFWLNWSNQKVITVPANKWTYFSYELAVDYPGLTSVDNVTFQIVSFGKTILFDNIMFTK